MPTAKILAGLAKFHESAENNREVFERLASQDQAPEALVIGCSDSRVPVELLAELDPGDLFVTRNIANIVPPYGTGEMSVGAVIEYAVLHLHIPHIVILGHTDCGGIQALDSPPDWSREPHIARWIEHARPAKTKIEASGLPQEERHLATVRENVLLQLEHLRSYDAVRAGERDGGIRLHGWVYHLETGAFEAYDPQSTSWRPVASSAELQARSTPS
jgi:carbonic anhydrase